MLIQRWYKRLRRKWLLRRADVHVVSFPKCGRTWLVLLLAKVIEMRYGVMLDNPLKLRRYKRVVPGLPLILQHHDGGPEFQRPDELATDKSAYAGRKVVFLVRDPRDVTVSAYYQKTKRNYNFEGSLAAYVYHPVGSIETNVAFYNIWARQRHVPKGFLLVTYEDMHRDPVGELKRVVDFVGISGVTQEMLVKAVTACSFDNMRRMETENALGSKRLAPRDVSDSTTYKTRSGTVGGYQQELAENEIAHIGRLIDVELDDYYAFYKSPEYRARPGRGA